MKKYIYLLLAVLVFIAVFVAASTLQNKENSDSGLKETEQIAADSTKGESSKPQITFVELGSVNCIPCKKMQPVMKSIEEKYAGQVEVIFYDVWQADQKKYAKQYNIKSIPTQVFLDSAGTEISRHIGFYPEKEIDKFLQSQGLKPIQKNG